MRATITFIIFLSLLSSCDVVKDPYQHIQTVDTVKLSDNLDSLYNDSAVNFRRILIEDFTGHKCPNCPDGTRIAEKLVMENPDKVLIAAIHNSGNFSKVDLPKYPSDFETDFGEDLRIQFKIASFPNGLINRKIFNASAIVGKDSWKNTVETLLADNSYTTPDFRVSLLRVYDTENNSIILKPRISALKALTGDIEMLFYILESHIIAPQDDQDNGGYLNEYEHNHVLRHTLRLNGTSGIIFTDPVQNEVYQNFSNDISLVIDDAWVPENCEVMMLLVNNTTDEVLFSDLVHATND